MNLYIQYELNETGKGKFLRRLIPELESLGVGVQFNSKGADLALLVIRNRDKKLPKCPKIIRLDGLSLNPEDRNKYKYRLKHEINPCDAIIYQSKFSKYMYDGILKPKVKKTFIIHNGADPKEFDVEPHKSDYPINVLLMSRWYRKQERAYKRLRQLVPWIYTYCSLNEKTKFWIIGEKDPDMYYFSSEQVEFIGQLEDCDLKPYLKMADIYLHMPEYSWCDNSLIEAICAGCYPVVSNIGGNAEVVAKTVGTIIDNDLKVKAKREYDYEPQSIDWKELTERMTNLGKPIASVNSDSAIHIKNIAKQYYNAFKEVLGAS